MAGEVWIVNHEDPQWSTTAWNPYNTSTGHAFGLGQLTDEIRQEMSAKTGIPANTTDACGQVTLMRAYIHERYGSTAAAVSWWQAHGWY